MTSPAGAAVLVDDERRLRARALQFLEQFRRPLGLGHDVRRTDQVRERVGVGMSRALQEHVLHVHEADDVVEALAVDEQARVLGLAQPRPQVAERGIGADGDDVGTRRHHFANQPLLEADERAEQLARLLLVLARVGLDLGLRRGLLLPRPAARRRRGGRCRRWRRPSGA